MAINIQAEFVSLNFTSNRIIIKDITGIDSSDGTNGGYGLSDQATNLSKVQLDEELAGWLLTVTRPDNTVFVVPINTLQFDVFESEIELYIDDTQDLINGLWSFKLDVNEANGILDTVIITKYIYNINALEIKINSNFATTVEFESPLSKTCNKNILSLFSYFAALKAAIDEENTISADYISAQINKLLT